VRCHLIGPAPTISHFSSHSHFSPENCAKGISSSHRLIFERTSPVTRHSNIPSGGANQRPIFQELDRNPNLGLPARQKPLHRKYRSASQSSSTQDLPASPKDFLSRVLSPRLARNSSLPFAPVSHEIERAMPRDLPRDYDDRQPRRSDKEPGRGDPSTRRGGSKLNEFFVDGQGINREVLQREICRFLGPEAHSRPSTYNV